MHVILNIYAHLSSFTEENKIAYLEKSMCVSDFHELLLYSF